MLRSLRRSGTFNRRGCTSRALAVLPAVRTSAVSLGRRVELRALVGE